MDGRRHGAVRSLAVPVEHPRDSIADADALSGVTPARVVCRRLLGLVRIVDLSLRFN